MRAKITHMWGSWEYYYVGSEFGCRDDTDKAAYLELLRDPSKGCVQMGKVLVERVPAAEGILTRELRDLDYAQTEARILETFSGLGKDSVEDLYGTLAPSDTLLQEVTLYWVFWQARGQSSEYRWFSGLEVAVSWYHSLEEEYSNFISRWLRKVPVKVPLSMAALLNLLNNEWLRLPWEDITPAS